MSVFSRATRREFARILRPGGVVVTVTRTGASGRTGRPDGDATDRRRQGCPAGLRYVGRFRRAGRTVGELPHRCAGCFGRGSVRWAPRHFTVVRRRSPLAARILAGDRVTVPRHDSGTNWRLSAEGLTGTRRASVRRSSPTGNSAAAHPARTGPSPPRSPGHPPRRSLRPALLEADHVGRIVGHQGAGDSVIDHLGDATDGQLPPPFHEGHGLEIDDARRFVHRRAYERLRR